MISVPFMCCINVRRIQTVFCHYSVRVISMFSYQSQSDKDVSTDIQELLYIPYYSFHIVISRGTYDVFTIYVHRHICQHMETVSEFEPSPHNKCEITLRNISVLFWISVTFNTVKIGCGFKPMEINCTLHMKTGCVFYWRLYGEG